MVARVPRVHANRVTAPAALLDAVGDDGRGHVQALSEIRHDAEGDQQGDVRDHVQADVADVEGPGRPEQQRPGEAIHRDQDHRRDQEMWRDLAGDRGGGQGASARSTRANRRTSESPAPVRSGRQRGCRGQAPASTGPLVGLPAKEQGGESLRDLAVGGFEQVLLVHQPDVPAAIRGASSIWLMNVSSAPEAPSHVAR